MLKKAGIVVAAAAAGLLAVSPLAFAGDYDGDNGHDGDHGRHHGKKHHDGHGVDCDQENSVEHEDGEDHSLISVSRNSIQVPIQACGNDVLSGVLGIVAKDLENSSNDH